MDSGKATVRVKEKLEWWPEPFNEAVMTSPVVAGAFVLMDDGGFHACSQVFVDLTKLKDEDAAAHFPGVPERPHQQDLNTKKFPFAVLVPEQVDGIPVPLPATGDWKATLRGSLSLAGKTRVVTWDLHAVRTAAELKVDGSTYVTFAQYDLPFSTGKILTADEHIQIEITLTAQRSG